MEDIIQKTAKEINSGEVNVYDVDWEEVTVFQIKFITAILKLIDIDKIEDTHDAIISNIEEKYLNSNTCGEILVTSFYTSFDDPQYHLPQERDWVYYKEDINNAANLILERKQKAVQYAEKISYPKDANAKDIEALLNQIDLTVPANRKLANAIGAVFEAISQDAIYEYDKNELLTKQINVLQKENEELKQEVDRLKEKYAFEGEDKGEPLETEFTATPRQVILMFRALGIDIESGDVNKIATSQFLSKLTGKNQQNIRTRLSGFDENSKQTKKDKEIVEKMISDTGIRRK